MRRIFILVLAVVATIFAAIHFTGIRAVADDSVGPSTQAASSAATKPADNSDPINVDAEALCQAYKDNEVRADSVYGDRILIVSGVVKRIAINSQKQPVVVLNGADDAPAVAGVFGSGADSSVIEQVKALNVGDKIEIYGFVKGPFDSTVRLWSVGLGNADAKPK
jgi:tRNA_anti-like